MRYAQQLVSCTTYGSPRVCNVCVDVRPVAAEDACAWGSLPAPDADGTHICARGRRNLTASCSMTEVARTNAGCCDTGTVSGASVRPESSNTVIPAGCNASAALMTTSVMLIISCVPTNTISTIAATSLPADEGLTALEQRDMVVVPTRGDGVAKNCCRSSSVPNGIIRWHGGVDTTGSAMPAPTVWGARRRTILASSSGVRLKQGLQSGARA